VYQNIRNLSSNLAVALKHPIYTEKSNNSFEKYEPNDDSDCSINCCSRSIVLAVTPGETAGITSDNDAIITHDFQQINSDADVIFGMDGLLNYVVVKLQVLQT
jgi:hypothetical protein